MNDSFTFKIDEQSINSLNKLLELQPKEEVTIGIDYGNGKSKSFIGNFYVSGRGIYKKKKIGKRYKFIKIKNTLYQNYSFVGGGKEISKEERI